MPLSFLRRILSSTAKPKRGRPLNQRKTYEAETLPPRAMLTVFASFNTVADQLEITSDSQADIINVGVSGGDVVVNGQTVANGGSNLEPGDVAAILVHAGAGGDIIQLSNVTSANGFSGLDYSVVVNAGDGRDFIIGSEFSDFLYGEGGNDTLMGESGNDSGYGGDANGIGTGDDQSYGGSGNDTYFADGGDDYIAGDSGNDDFYVAWGGASGNKTVAEYSGGGSDRVVLSGMSQGATFDLGSTATQTLQTGFTVRLSVFETIENVAGTAYRDTLTGNSLANSLDGGGTYLDGGGQDTLYGRAGDDLLWSSSSSGNQGIVAYGEAGNDMAYGGLGDDILVGGDGYDVLVASSGDDVGYGGDANGGGSDGDEFYGDSGDDIYFADGGNDYIDGGTGDDEFYVAWNGGSGAKTISESSSGGTDRIRLSGLPQDVTFNLASTAQQKPDHRVQRSDRESEFRGRPDGDVVRRLSLRNVRRE